VAYWMGFCVNFTLQRRVTFALRGPVGGALLRYSALVVVNYVGTVVLVDGANSAGIGYATGKIVAVSLFVAVNYFAYGRWVFRDRELTNGR
jgi:putative flippase GtrA